MPHYRDHAIQRLQNELLLAVVRGFEASPVAFAIGKCGCSARTGQSAKASEEACEQILLMNYTNWHCHCEFVQTLSPVVRTTGGLPRYTVGARTRLVFTALPPPIGGEMAPGTFGPA